ncbi:MAG: M28 family peptidase [Planctomycetota bacterium]
MTDMEPQALNRQNTADFRPGERVQPASLRKRNRFTPPTRWIKFATELLRLPTAPFHEQNIMLWVWQFARNRGLPVRLDDAGNLIVDFVPDDADPGLRRLLFTAHMDHVGFWALGPSDNAPADDGLLRAHWMGRFPEELFVGAPVTFWTGGRPLSSIEPDLSGPGLDASRARIGGKRVTGTIDRVVSYNPAGDVAQVDVRVDEPVEPGSIGMWSLPEPTHFNGRLSGGAIDDVAGVAALVCLMDSFNRAELRRPVTCLFTRCEEGGFFGAIRYCRQHFGPEASAPEAARPELVVSVEASKALPLTPLGSGPIARVGDRHGVFDPEVCAWVDRCAQGLAERHRDFNYQRRLMDGGTCESSVFQAWTGRAGAVCIPLGNYHNFNPATGALDAETVDVSDWGNLVRLMLEMTGHTGTAGGVYDSFRTWCEDWEQRHAGLYRDPSGLAPDAAPTDTPPDTPDPPAESG